MAKNYSWLTPRFYYDDPISVTICPSLLKILFDATLVAYSFFINFD